MGGKVTGKVETDGAKVITAGGSVNHEIGTTRMSATREGRRDQFIQCQTGNARTSSSIDGAPFVSSPVQEPDAHHPRARLARLRLPDGRDEARQYRLISARPRSSRRPAAPPTS